MTELRTLDIIENTLGFDADWYSHTFPDAAILGMDARRHYAAFGYFLGRGISASIADLSNQPAVMTALSRRPRISYCTPIMNRPDDIRGTLQANLDANRPLSDLVEFIIVFMDNDTETHDWVRATFPDEIASGYLRLVVEPPLDGWHFGKAKNRHRNYAIGSLYSSVDGDNFVTLEETQQLLELMDAYPDGFLFHHFTGNWGDGSSGRITVPMEIYRRIGYDENFMPRQFDEMDVLLSAMIAHPEMPLIRLEGKNHGFGSKRSKEFFQTAKVRNPIVDIGPVERQLPLNPKTEGYVQDDHSMEAMTAFNQGVSFLKNARNAKQRNQYLRLAIEGRHKVVDTVPREKILGTLFHSTGYPDPASLEIGPDDVCVFSCMKNDENFLVPFYEHYKALGIKHFFIVDDGSDIPISESLPHPDVHVLRPKVGSFLTAKGMWMEGMMKGYLQEGQWALTLDADEFMDLPAGYDSFPDLTRVLRARGQETMPALLIDLVPDPNVSPEALERVETDFLDVFSHHVWIDTPIDDTYRDFDPIRWGFGPFAQISWQLDTRYHAFQTLDSLRKIPLIQWRTGRHINQGFHTLHYSDDTPNPGSEIWETDMVLPIRHFKLLKLFSTTARARMAAQVAAADTSAYHARTTANIAKIFGGGEEQMQRVLALSSRPLTDDLLTNLDPRTFK
ncbi:glycosyltransferase family 2 protein [Thalassococcus sp. S3]|uniref:glycosyltransferase family 2 protein n=1 Tax=Thalassococcus sp. S3 TaxID=2017482 RepID=UPI00102412DF|nr:glycosyltransferase family 2 protein [Thalassococcus sp. S3]QBF34265.1 hypothetical protein CFI11_24065 [Thalassococcus sp. S3]